MSVQDQLKAVLARKRAQADPRLRATRDALATWLPAEELLIATLPEGPEKDQRTADWESHLKAYQKLVAALGDVSFTAEALCGDCGRPSPGFLTPCYACEPQGALL